MELWKRKGAGCIRGIAEGFRMPGFAGISLYLENADGAGAKNCPTLSFKI